MSGHTLHQEFQRVEVVGGPEHGPTGEVLDTWDNPITGLTVRVVHVHNDPVQRFYPLEKGPFAPPYPYLVNGDNLVFQLDVFRPPAPGNNPLTRAEYPLHSQQDLYQTGELWAIHGSLQALNNPENTRVPCHTAWGRISMWEPFFEMGNRPGCIVYHSQAFTTPNGIDDIDPIIVRYMEKHHPQFLEYPYAPTEWGDGFQENHWTYAQKIIDKAREDGSGWDVYTRGGRHNTGIDAVAWAEDAARRGAGEILLTSMDRDGTKIGFNLDLTRAVAEAVPVPVIASGGVGELDHFVDGIQEGKANAVLAASVFHFGTFSIGQVKAHMAQAGIPMRELKNP